MNRFMLGLLEILVIVLLFILGNVLDFIFGFGTMNRIVTDFGKFDGFIIIRFNFVMIRVLKVIIVIVIGLHFVLLLLVKRCWVMIDECFFFYKWVSKFL